MVMVPVVMMEMVVAAVMRARFASDGPSRLTGSVDRSTGDG